MADKPTDPPPPPPPLESVFDLGLPEIRRPGGDPLVMRLMDWLVGAKKKPR